MKKIMRNSPRHLASVTICLLAVAFAMQFIGSAEANFFPIPIPQPAITIKSDGSVDPPTAPLQRAGDVYTFTGNIAGYTIASERDNITIDGNGYALQGNGNSTGIFLKNRSGVTVRNINVTGFTYGIRLFAEDFMGMTSTGNTISNNVVEDNEYGLHLSYSSSNTLRSNHISNNTYNFWINGGFISNREGGYINDIDASNTVDGKPIIYWVNVRNETVPDGAGFVAFVNCTNVTARGLNLSKNGQGVLVVSTSKANIAQNAVAECSSGIHLFNSTDATVAENNLEKNDEGIRGESSSGNLMKLNNVTSHKIGIYFTGACTNNIIAANNITSNTVDGLNLWGSTNTSLTENLIAFNNETGINFFDSRKNNVTANTITNNTGIGIKLWYDADENVFSKNNITNNNIGIVVNDSFDNTFIGNTLRENREWGMRFEADQNNNVIWQNSFIGNRPAGDGLQVSVTGTGILEPKPGGGNIWDNDTEGNYWSDYKTRYPNATEAESSGTGNTPYFMNENNIDRHPLMTPPEDSNTSQPSPNPTANVISPSPSIPELATWTVIPLLLALAILIAYRKKQNQENRNQMKHY